MGLSRGNLHQYTDGHEIINLRIVESGVIHRQSGGRRGRDRVVVGFTTYAISAYHH